MDGFVPPSHRLLSSTRNRSSEDENDAKLRQHDGDTSLTNRGRLMKPSSHACLHISSSNDYSDDCEHVAYVEAIDSEDLELLRAALRNSDAIVTRQQEELLKAAQRVEELESYLRSMNIDLPPARSRNCNKENVGVPKRSPRRFSGRPELLIRSISQNGTREDDSSAENSGGGTPLTLVSAFTHNSDCENGPDTKGDVSVDSSNFVTPKSSELHFFDTPIDTATASTRFTPPQEGRKPPVEVALSDKKPRKKVGKPPSNLAARLALAPADRRKLVAQSKGDGDSNAPLKQNLTLPPGVLGGMKRQGSKDSESTKSFSSGPSTFPNMSSHSSRAASPKPKLPWLGPTSPDNSNPVFIFIAHDNPQLGATVAAQVNMEENGMSKGISSSGNSGTVLNRNGTMRIMLECKDDDDRTHFILGNIVYSGDFEHIDNAELQNQRGSGCLVVTDIIAIRCHLKQFITQWNGDIMEIDLEDLPSSDNRVDVSDEEKLKQFLTPCKARVDVILDPYHTQHKWFPYWEGRRKMAPQFRSRGIGYIRLGDDMSRYGTAFLSLDAGRTYLDDGATQVVMSEVPSDPFRHTLPVDFSPSPFSFSESTSEKISSNESVNERKKQLLRSRSDRRSMSSGIRKMVYSNRSASNDLSDDTKSGNGFVLNDENLANGSRRLNPDNVNGSGGVANSHRLFENELEDMQRSLDDAKEIVAVLKEKDLKWAERADLLKKLQIHLVSLSLCQQSQSFLIKKTSALTDIISLLTEQLTKQKNPHVLLASLSCVQAMTFGTALYSFCGLPWRQLLLETIHFLRSTNKLVHEASRVALTHIYQGRYESLTMPILASLLEDIFAGPRGKGSGGAVNTAKVLSWIHSIVLVEIDRAVMKCSGVTSSPHSVCETTTDLNHILLALQHCMGLLAHREGATRDATILVVTSFLILDALSSSNQKFSALSKALSKLSQQSESKEKSTVLSSIYAADADSKNISNKDILLRAISSDVAQAVSKIEDSIPKVFERIVDGTVLLLTQTALSASQNQHVLVTNVLDQSKKVSAGSDGGDTTLERQTLSTENSNTEVTSMKDAIGLLKSSKSKRYRRPFNIESAEVSPLSHASDAETNTLPQVSNSNGSDNQFAKSRTSSRDSYDSGCAEVSVEDKGEFKPSSPRFISSTIFRSPAASLHGYKSNLNGYSEGSGVNEAFDRSDSRGLPLISPRTAGRIRPFSPRTATTAICEKPKTPRKPEQAKVVDLYESWYEMKLLLRQVPVDETDCQNMCEVLNESQIFFMEMESLASSSSWAVGKILRYVLPFNEDASSSDQSAVAAMYIDVPSELKPQEASLQMLRNLAVRLRKLMRIKMADETDFKQARTAARMLLLWSRELKKVSSSTNMPMYQIVKNLQNTL